MRATQTKMIFRGVEWVIRQTDEATTLIRYGIQPGRLEVIQWVDLSLNEQAIVSQALDAARNKDDQKARVARQRFEATQKEKTEILWKGGVLLRNFVWHVEAKHIWRISLHPAPEKIVKLNFSELTDEEIASVMLAKEREIQNRGIGGFFRRIVRKLENY